MSGRSSLINTVRLNSYKDAEGAPVVLIFPPSEFAWVTVSAEKQSTITFRSTKSITIARN